MSDPVRAEFLRRSKQLYGQTEGDFLEPECLLPVQYNDMLRKRSSAPEGESRLLLAVLKDALLIFITTMHGRTRQARREFLEVVAWFNAENQDGVFAYENVCDALGLEPEALRKRLASLLHAPSTLRDQS